MKIPKCEYNREELRLILFSDEFKLEEETLAIQWYYFV